MKRKNVFFKAGVLLLSLLLLPGLSGCGAISDQTTTPTPPATPTPAVIGLGQAQEFGSFDITVTQVYQADQLPTPLGTLKPRTGNYLCLIEISLENTGDTTNAYTLDLAQVQLIASNGNTYYYEALKGGRQFYPSAGASSAELIIELEANMSSTQTIAFAIPESATPTELILPGLLPFSLSR